MHIRQKRFYICQTGGCKQVRQGAGYSSYALGTALTSWIIGLTLCSIVWSLWIRRLTWRLNWEVAATLVIALQGAAVFLMSPVASATLGVLLHHFTGEWNLEDYLGHDCYIVAASAAIYHALGRLGTDKTQQRMFTQWVQRPVTLCIPVMLSLFSQSDGVKQYISDFIEITPDDWLDAYWVALCSVLVYLMVFGIRAFSALRAIPESRHVANVYIAAGVAGIIGCMAKLITAFDYHLELHDHGLVVWLFAGICGATFTFISSRSWLDKSDLYSKRRKARLHGHPVDILPSTSPDGEDSHVE